MLHDNMHLNSAGCIFRWRDWAATCNISQQEKHFGEAVILRFSAYCLLRFNKKVVSKWLGEKIQGLDKIFTWRKNFLKPKYLQTTTSYKVWHCGQRDQSDTFCVFYWLQKAGKYTEPLRMHYWQNSLLVGHLFLKILTSRAATSGGRTGWIRVCRDFSAASISWNR